MLLEDLETFCGDASSSTKIVALKRMLQSLGRNGFDFEVSQRFHEICSIIFSAEGKPLLTDPKVAEDMVSLLKFDENSATSLPVILQKTIHQTRGFLVNSNSSPYFIIAPNKLRPHTQNLLNHGEIELLPSFIRNRLHETEEKNESTILTTSDRIPNYEIRLDILEYYFYWFINFPHNQKQLVESSHLKESSKSKPTSSTPHWVKFLSPKKQTTKKTKLKTTNVYAELLKNYLEHFIPYEISGRNKTPSTFLEMIITSWFDYGNTPTHRKENIHDNIEIPSKACLEAIKVVVTYAVSDPALKEAGKNGDEYTIAGAPCRDIQKPLYDFLCASYSILSDAQPSHIHNLLFDIWMTFTLPWNSHKEKKELKQLSDNWILFIKQNILVYLTPTRKFLEYARMNFNTAAKEQDLQLFEKFVSNFLNLDLYKHIRDSVATLNDVKSGGLYTNQTVDRAIIQRHCGSMDVNICQLTDLEELFTKEKNSLPLTILQNLSSDIMYCYKYLPDISQVSRIEKLAENFATIFGLESKWQDIKPRGRSGRRVKSTERHKVSKNSRHRLLEVDLSADYWQAPLMTFENAMAARFAYRLAVKLRDNYEMEELPHIRWLASYKIWGLTLFCMFLLYVVWRIAVLLAHLLSA